MFSALNKNTRSGHWLVLVLVLFSAMTLMEGHPSQKILHVSLEILFQNRWSRMNQEEFSDPLPLK